MNAYLIMALIIVISYLGHNMSVVYAALILVIAKLLLPLNYMDYIAKHGINWGIIVLTIAILVPIATGEIGIQEIVDVFKTPLGIITILTGIAVAIFGGMGVDFLKNDPHIVVSLVIGTIIGVCFFKGVPVGPLIAGGMVYCLLKLGNFVTGYFS